MPYIGTCFRFYTKMPYIGTCFRFHMQMRVENNNKAFAYRVPLGDYNYLQCRTKKFKAPEVKTNFKQDLTCIFVSVRANL